MPVRRAAPLCVILLSFLFVLPFTQPGRAASLATIHVTGTYPNAPTVTRPAGWSCGGYAASFGGDIWCSNVAVPSCSMVRLNVFDSISGPLVPKDKANVSARADCGFPEVVCTAPLPAAITILPPFSSANTCSASASLTESYGTVQCIWSIAPPVYVVDVVSYDVTCDFS